MDKFEYHKRMTADRALTHAEYRLLATLWDYADADGTNIHPGRERMEQHSTLSDKKVRDALRKLLDAGYIVETTKGGRVKGGRGLATVYRLSIPQAWITGVPSTESYPQSGTEYQGFDPETGVPTTPQPGENPQRVDTGDHPWGVLSTADGGYSVPEKGGTQYPPTRSLPNQSTKSSSFACDASVPPAQAMDTLTAEAKGHALKIIRYVASNPDRDFMFEDFLMEHVSEEASGIFTDEWTIPQHIDSQYDAATWLGKFMNSMDSRGVALNESETAA